MGNKLYSLAETILKDGKMTSESIMKHFAHAISECNCGSYEDEYRELYESAYGKTINKELAEEIVYCLAVTDGSNREHGEKWTIDATSEYAHKVGVTWDDISKNEWYVIMNMMYSDYYELAYAYELQEDTMFYAKAARCWVFDKDIKDVSKKLYDYYFHVIVDN